MLSFGFSCYQTGESRRVRSHDSDRRCPCVSDRPGLPPCSPRVSGGLVWLFGGVHLLTGRKCTAFKKREGLGPQNHIKDSFTGMDPAAAAGLGAGAAPWCHWSSAPAALGLDWERLVALGSQQWPSAAFAAGSCQKKHRLVPPTSQHLTEYVQLNVLGTALHDFQSIYNWRKIIFRWQLNPFICPLHYFSLTRKPGATKRPHSRA